jgi:hypothetical protein
MNEIFGEYDADKVGEKLREEHVVIEREGDRILLKKYIRRYYPGSYYGYTDSYTVEVL